MGRPAATVSHDEDRGIDRSVPEARKEDVIECQADRVHERQQAESQEHGPEEERAPGAEGLLDDESRDANPGAEVEVQ